MTKAACDCEWGYIQNVAFVWKLLLNFQFCPHPACETHGAITERQTHYYINCVCHYKCVSASAAQHVRHLHFTRNARTRQVPSYYRLERRERWESTHKYYNSLSMTTTPSNERCYFVVVIINLYISEVFWCSVWPTSKSTHHFSVSYTRTHHSHTCRRSGCKLAQFIRGVGNDINNADVRTRSKLHFTQKCVPVQHLPIAVNNNN